MVKIEIYYEIIFKKPEENKIEDSKEKNNGSLVEKKEELDRNDNGDNPGYYLELMEEPCKLTRAKVEEFLIDDGMEQKYISSSFIEYDLKKNGELSPNVFKELKEPYQHLEKNSTYKLHLHLIIDEANYLKNRENEKLDLKKKEDDENKEIYSKVSQITKELKEIQRQIKNLQQKPIDEENDKQYKYFKEIRKRKDSFHSKVKKNIMKEEYQKEIEKLNKNKAITFIQTSNTFDGKDKKSVNEKDKILFLYSHPLQNIQAKKFYQEDDSYFKQWLYIYKLFKEKRKGTEPYLKQINENLDWIQKPIILHIRVDSILKEDGCIYFKFCGENENICEYNFNELFKSANNFKNLKLLIISSDNIEKIMEKMKEIQTIKNINKIYIFHPNKYDNINKLEYEKKLDYENKENEFIKKLYEYLLSNGVKNSFEKSKIENLTIGIFPNGKQKCFTNSVRNLNQEKNNEKFTLNYDLIKDHYYPVIGRRDEHAQILLKKEGKMCVYGEIGVGKKCFIKKLGFSFFKRGIVNKTYYLDIYPIEIEQSQKIYKIDIIIDEINNNNKDSNILLIIYFNGILKNENLIALKNEIKRERERKKNNVSIKYLYAFTTDKNSTNISRINEILYSFELKNFINLDKNEVKNLFNYFLKNKIDDIKIIDDIFDNVNQVDKNKTEPSEIKITNIYLFLVYFNLFYEELISSHKFKSEDNLIKIRKIIFEDKFEAKKNIIKLIINKNENKEIFIVLNILRYGVGINFLKLLWKDNWEEKTNYIKQNLFGLIIQEKNENEEIYKLDNSLRDIIRENYKELIPKYEKEILKNYQFILRKINSQLEYNKILNFNASIHNNFWSNEEYMKNEDSDSNQQYIFNDEIDSNNIYDIIRNIEIKDDLLSYIDDISITLPTILHYNHNYIYEDLILKLFEEKLEGKYKEFKKKYKNNDQKVKNMRKLIIRLGIFKCWTSKKLDFLNTTLEKVDIGKKSEMHLVTNETKIECCLIKIYEYTKKGNKKIDELRDDCKSFIDKIEEEKNKKNYEIRYKALCARALNSIEEIEDLLKLYPDYKKELNLLKKQIIMYSAKCKFYFFLQNPLTNTLCEKIEINNNFYLTQNLYKIIPKNLQVEFKSFNDNYKVDELNDLKNIIFLYLANKSLFKQFIQGNDKTINITILILGYLDKELTKDNIKDLHNKGIKNIIYISNIDEKCQELIYFIPKYCIFEKMFYEFIHNFISILVSKKNNININKAFQEAKGNFNKSFRYLQNYDIKLAIPKIEIDMDDDDNTFEFEHLDEDIETSNNEDINYLKNEFAYEDEKSKNDNVYYRKNPFSERKEIEKELSRGTILSYIRLPGIDYINDDIFKNFLNGGIYDIKKFEQLVNSIRNTTETNVFYIYGQFIYQIGDDLCKYFFMEKMYKNGIYIVRSISNKEEFKRFIDSIAINKNDSKLFLFDKSFNMNNIIDDEIIGKMNKLNNTFFIICSEKKEINKDKIKYYEFCSESKDQNIIQVNERYKVIQSIINNIYIK